MIIGILGLAKNEVLLRLFVQYIEVRNKWNFSIEKTDFFSDKYNVNDSEEYMANDLGRINPSRAVFRGNDTKGAHHMFATGENRQRAVVKMEAITICRIATEIITLFSLEYELEEHFEFFKDTRFLPDSINVCINKTGGELHQDKLNEIKGKIIDFFDQRRIMVKNILFMSTDSKEGIEDFIELVATLTSRDTKD